MTTGTFRAAFEIVSRERLTPEAQVTALFEKLYSPLMRYLLSLRLSLSDAEEVVQETFLALFHHVQNGRPDANLHGWVFTVAHRLAWKHRLSARRRLQRLLPFVSTWRAADPHPSPHERVEGLQRQSRLLAVFDALPERDRRCLRLRSEGLRYREIAAALGMSLGTVANSLERSYARLRASDQERGK